MATNDTYQKIIKQVFKGNVGKQMQLLRDRENIRFFLENDGIPTEEEQSHIDSVNEEWELYDSKIRVLLGETKLGEIKNE